MQVFIIGTPLETAKAMSADKRRYNKQIVECKQILDALNGKSAWSNHPCTLQYKEPLLKEWLIHYWLCLSCYIKGDIGEAMNHDEICEIIKPKFHTHEYLDNMKSRLYTKDPILYSDFSKYGKSEINMYFVDGVWRKYINGKRIE